MNDYSYIILFLKEKVISLNFGHGNCEKVLEKVMLSHGIS